MFSKFRFPQILSIIIISLFISVIFVYANWSAPLNNPPICVSGDPGCDAPLNVGPISQFKTGSLGVNGIIQSMSGFCIGNNCITSWPSGGNISCNWTGSQTLVSNKGLDELTFNCSGKTTETRANYWDKCERGGTRLDNCNGDNNNRYSCSSGENRTCHDEWSIGGCGAVENRWGEEDVTCTSIAGVITSITK